MFAGVARAGVKKTSVSGDRVYGFVCLLMFRAGDNSPAFSFAPIGLPDRGEGPNLENLVSYDVLTDRYLGVG